MAREIQISYGQNTRLYGTPTEEGHRQEIPRSDYYGSRKVHALNHDMETWETVENQCVATTKSGAQCKAHPAKGESLCTFHKE
jgi:hypothetical protein